MNDMTEKEAIEKIKQTPLMRYIADRNPKGELGEALEMAVQALEKQIPKKVAIRINPEDVHIGSVVFRKGVKTYKCKCGSFVTLTCKYCPECGQRLEF